MLFFPFGEEELNAFEKLKHALSSLPLLALYSLFLDTELHCDAV